LYAVSRQGAILLFIYNWLMRNESEVCKLFESGRTQEEIASLFSVTKARIQQVLKLNGLTRIAGGASLRAKKRGLPPCLLALQAGVESRYLKRWGISRADGDSIKAAFGYRPFLAFKNQKLNARKRGIPFDFTFGQWWELWTSSGKWNLRGRGGYVMTRPGDAGPYCVNNVAIKTQAENLEEVRDRGACR
jgi:hypothetical protein